MSARLPVPLGSLGSLKVFQVSAGPQNAEQVSGVQSQIPAGGELEAFLARKQGWDLAAHWYGSYANAGQVGSPVKSFTNALRIYSSFIGGESLVVGCDAASANIEWHEGVRTTLLAERDGAKVWRASR